MNLFMNHIHLNLLKMGSVLLTIFPSSKTNLSFSLSYVGTLIALFFLNYRVASAINLFFFIYNNYLFCSWMAFQKVFSLVLALSLWEKIVFAAVSQFMEVKVAWVQIAADLKCRVSWHLFSSDLLLQTLIKLLSFFILFFISLIFSKFFYSVW